MRETMKRISALLAALAFAPAAYAADLGGQGCCADLEERVAELEATAARKGNRKVSLQIYGQINKALLYVDGGGDTEEMFIENGASPSRVGFRGEAKISEGYKAGYVLEVGAGSYDLFVGNSNSLSIRHSFAFLETPVGKLSLGQTSQASDGIAEISAANTDAAMNTLNLKPLFAISPWDGDRTNLVRYDSPTVGGFIVSASWADSVAIPLIAGFSYPAGESWDVALRYAGEFAGIKLAAGAGYKTTDLFFDDLVTVSGSVSAKHVGTGLFATVAAGRAEVDLFDARADAGHAVVGIERNILGFGATTFYGEALKGTLEIGTADADAKMYGVGIVQAVDAAAVDIYATYRSSDDLDVSYGLAGIRAKF
jgi:predicted porin